MRAAFSSFRFAWAPRSDAAVSSYHIRLLVTYYIFFGAWDTHDENFQRGLEPQDRKPLKSLALRQRNPREDATGGVIHLTTRPEAVYVLHCFQKKTENTSRQDIESARKPFKAVPRKYIEKQS